MVEGPDIYIPSFLGKQKSNNLQCEVACWSALAVAGSVQLAAAHYPN